MFSRHRARGTTAKRSGGTQLSARSSSAATPPYQFRREILRPFLDQYLKDGAPKADIAPVTAFETGRTRWRRLPAWPAACATECSVTADAALPARGSEAQFAAPAATTEPAFDEYVSDPDKPVPFRAAPDRPGRADRAARWRSGSSTISARDSDATGRRSLHVSDVLTEPRQDQRRAGRRISSRRRAERTADWVVKLIDVYPDEVPGAAGDGRIPARGLDGHLPRALSRELRDAEGRSRRTGRCSTASPCRRRTTSSCPGHRIMVQVQSSWFPLYDRNPQTFVPSIFFAKPGDYRKAHAAHLPRAGPGQLHRAAAGDDALVRTRGIDLKEGRAGARIGGSR